MEKITLKLQEIILKILESNVETDVFKKYKEIWLTYKQNLQGFKGDHINNNQRYSSCEFQFCLESILALVMRLSLICNDKIENLSLTKTIEFGYRNISKMIFESDFYSWLLKIQDLMIIQEIKLLSRILKEKNFLTFNKLYEQFFCRSGRKSKGQFYTELDIAEFIIRSSDFPQKDEVIALDPACGAGSFIVTLLDYWKEKYHKNSWTIIGIDVSYFACLMSRIAYLKWFKLNSLEEKIDFIPIFWMDYLIDFSSQDFSKKHPNNKKIIGLNSKYEKISFDFLSEVFIQGIDIIIGNPPFLRTKNIPFDLRKKHRIKFKSAQGSYDIYVLFLEHSLNIINDNGRLAFICSNKFLTTNYGKGIRSIIRNNATINKIIDFTDTHMFNVSALTSIIIFTKTKSNIQFYNTQLTTTKEKHKKSYNRVEFWNFLSTILDKPFNGIIEVKNFNNQRRKPNNFDSLKNIAISTFKSEQPKDDNSWHFLPKDLFDICNKIELNSDFLLKDIAKINVGIKTTCDEAFTFDEIPFNQSKSRRLVKPFINGRDVKKWKLSTLTSKFILYPYIKNGKNKSLVNLREYPEIEKHFLKFESKLKSRKYIMDKNENLWHQIWVPLHPDVFETENKIITPDISPNNRFALDRQKIYCNGTCYIINPFNNDINFSYYLLGLLNSNLLEFYHKAKLANLMYSKRWRYMYKNLSKYCIKDPRSYNHTIYQEIINLVKEIIDEKNQKNIEKLECEINQLIFELYKLSNEEISLIEKYLKVIS